MITRMKNMMITQLESTYQKILALKIAENYKFKHFPALLVF